MKKLNPQITNAVILGGNGAVGSLFRANLCESIHRTVVIDCQSKETDSEGTTHFVCSDVLHLSSVAKTALSLADLVIVALPETLAITAAESICSCINPQALLVDTLSNKTPYLTALSTCRQPKEIISLNPMFAPSLGFAHQTAAVIEVRRGLKANTLLQFLESWGCRLVFMKADEHDRCTSVLQAATHAAILAFGISIMKSDYDLNKGMQFMPPPHQAMLALLARIVNADPEVYWDIQSGNPYAEEARRNLQVSLFDFSTMIEKEDVKKFSSLFSDLKTFLTPEKEEELSRKCSEMFKSFRTSNT